MRGENPSTSAVRMDRDAYRRRNVIKRSTDRLKQARRAATRFEKHAVDFLAVPKLPRKATMLPDLPARRNLKHLAGDPKHPVLDETMASGGCGW
ncbi:MAG: hypothetical protein D6725_08015 [Planctomycetota bacterium]|nr:MAG: hypothetical protein D6725_08015 [Planctomycetota bacterium]